MKSKYVVPFLLVAVVVISGCTSIPQTSDKPFIKTFQASKPFAGESDRVDFLYTIYNPTEFNLNYAVVLQADTPDCFSMPYGSVGQLSRVEKKDVNLPSRIDTSGIISLTIPSGYQFKSSCYATHKLTLFLLQNVSLYDTKTIDFPIVSR